MIGPAPRRTVHGSAAFEERLDRDIRRIAEGVPPRLPGTEVRAVILGGGYGKGEGGVCRDNGRESPFNDLDFFIVVRSSGRKSRSEAAARLAGWSRELESGLGIDVDFGLKTESEWRRLPPAQMWVELKAGHEVVWGDPRIMDLCPTFNSAELGPAEGYRLLLNRGTGLLLARERLEAAPDPAPADVDFVARNVAKAGLGMGESWLIFQGAFHPSYRERSLRLAERREEGLVRKYGLDTLYAEALEYKLLPTRHIAAEELVRRWGDTAARFLAYYLETGGSRAADSVESKPVKNLGLNLRDFLRWGLRPRRPFGYPRERLFPALPYFLGPDGEKAPAARALGRRKETPRAGLRRDYDRVWRAYN